jgi:hypothetical protein
MGEVPGRSWVSSSNLLHRSPGCLHICRSLVLQAGRRRAAVKAVLNWVIVNPHADRKGGPMLSPELKLQFVRERTEFGWRF